MSYSKVITLEQFIVDQQSLYKDAQGSLSKIFRSLELAAKMVNRDVRKAGLVDILGNQGSTNVQGEEQKKLDVIANDIFIANLERSGEVCMIISEENDDVYYVEGAENEKYVVAMDPLDGSSNIDVNASIGTIFSIYSRSNPMAKPSIDDCLQKGKHQVAAGYFIYGSSTMLVYSTGVGVNGFTLDDGIQEFCLSHPNIQTPANGKIFSVNEGNFEDFPAGVQGYISYCKSKDKATDRPYSARYIGSLIADGSTTLDKTTQYKITFEPLMLLGDVLGLTSISTTDAVNKNGTQLKVKYKYETWRTTKRKIKSQQITVIHSFVFGNMILKIIE